MQRLTSDVNEILGERIANHSVISLATLDGNYPAVRCVNAYYEKGAFYIITHARSDKMKQLAVNPYCSVCGEWFRSNAVGISLGWVGAEENREIFAKLRTAFAEWIDNGHNDLSDKSCIILKVRLTNGIVFSQGTRYDVDFTNYN